MILLIKQFIIKIYLENKIEYIEKIVISIALLIAITQLHLQKKRDYEE